MEHERKLITIRPISRSSAANGKRNKLCGRPPQYAPSPVTLTFDPLTLKVVSESRVTCATSVPILVFLGFSVHDLGPMYATDVRQTSDVRVRQTSDSVHKVAFLSLPPSPSLYSLLLAGKNLQPSQHIFLFHV